MNVFQINLLLMVLYFVFFKFVWVTDKSDIRLNRIIAVQLFFILGFRYQFVGTDTVNYYNNFKQISYISFGEIFNGSYNDLGYVLLEWIGSRCHIEFQYFIMILAFFDIMVIAFMIERYSEHIFMSWILFVSLGFYGLYFNIMRQALAMSLLFLAFHFLYENKMSISILFYLFASSVHSTALMFGIIYILFKVHISVRNIAVLLFCVILFYIFRANIARIFMDLFRSGRYMEEWDSTLGSVGALFFIICICIVLIFLTNPPWKSEDSICRLYLSILLAAAGVQMFSAVSFVFTRLNQHFLQFIVICLPYTLKNINGIKITFPQTQWKYFYKFMIVLMIIMCCAYYLPGISGETAHDGILPYYFMWEK